MQHYGNTVVDMSYIALDITLATVLAITLVHYPSYCPGPKPSHYPS